LRAGTSELFGIQAWVALPKAHEETPPAFAHHPEEAMPLIEADGVRARVIAGELWGARSPVPTLGDMIYADVAMTAGARLPIDADHAERAVYVAQGAVEVAGDVHPAGELLVLRAGDALTMTAPRDARLMLLGGEPMDGPRYVWWNFVSSSRDRIEQAKADWRAGRFEAVPGEVEFTPLPDRTGP
jgi:hypothetical protein